MRFFKRKLLYPPKRNKHDDGSIGHKLRKAYVEYLVSIKPKLPKGAWELARLSFHDARVLSVVQPTKRELVITLDGAVLGLRLRFHT